MHDIQFIKDTSQAEIDKLDGDVLVLYREGYKLPKIESAEYMEFETFRSKYIDIHAKVIVLIGLIRMITPSNRCDTVHEYLTTLTPNIRKISIDIEPFLGEPWRLMWHYLYTKNNHFNVPHSYALETEWQKWFYRDINDSRISGNNIKMFIQNTYSDLDQFNSEFGFYDCASEEWYSEAKDHVFAKYNTPKQLINNLLKECNKKFDIKFSFESYRESKKFELPDLKVYRFVTEEAKRRMSIYNSVIS